MNGGLLAVVDELDGLFEGDGDEEADDDGCDVDEEVAPVLAAWCGGWTSSMGLGSCGVSGLGASLGWGAGRVGAGPGWGAGV